jgi:hypothetical protein
MNTECTKWPQSIQNASPIFQMDIICMYQQHFPSKDPQKITQIGISGLKINHLATLL